MHGPEAIASNYPWTVYITRNIKFIAMRQFSVFFKVFIGCHQKKIQKVCSRSIFVYNVKIIQNLVALAIIMAMNELAF